MLGMSERARFTSENTPLTEFLKPRKDEYFEASLRIGIIEEPSHRKTYSVKVLRLKKDPETKTVTEVSYQFISEDQLNDTLRRVEEQTESLLSNQVVLSQMKETILSIKNFGNSSPISSD
jgi:benzoyl-CoA reductase/2-hydroxyglutaryl-CoA dehydratase subunit BcrC/BadD/HgdB